MYSTKPTKQVEDKGKRISGAAQLIKKQYTETKSPQLRTPTSSHPASDVNRTSTLATRKSSDLLTSQGQTWNLACSTLVQGYDWLLISLFLNLQVRLFQFCRIRSFSVVLYLHGGMHVMSLKVLLLQHVEIKSLATNLLVWGMMPRWYPAYCLSISYPGQFSVASTLA